VVGTDDSKNAQDTLNPNLERGRGNANVTHRFVFSGVWDINYAHSLQNAAVAASSCAASSAAGSGKCDGP